MKKLTKYMTGILFGTFLLGTTAFAAEVTPVSGFGYTTQDTEVRTEASETGTLILTKEQCPDNIAVVITGVTDNGYWEVDLGQENKFYIKGTGLVNINGNGEQAAGQTTGAVNTNAVAVNDNVPIDELIVLYKDYANNKPNETEIQRMKKLYGTYMQAVNKLLNGTTNVTYYSDDNDIEIDYSYDVDYAVGTYFQKLYPSYTINYDSRTGYAYAENYVATRHFKWEG